MREADQQKLEVLYNGEGSLEIKLEMARMIGPNANLWAREEKTLVTHVASITSVRGYMEEIVWYKREQMIKLLPCMRFGLRRNRTLQEELDNEDICYNYMQLPYSIKCAIAVLTE